MEEKLEQLRQEMLHEIRELWNKYNELSASISKYFDNRHEESQIGIHDNQSGLFDVAEVVSDQQQGLFELAEIVSGLVEGKEDVE